ncbi:MAG: hypothetical protein ACRD12_02005 [Acidimicrobiales bacterium]
MNLDKLTSAEQIIAGSGIALLIFSFLPWFGFGGATHNGWATPFSSLAVLIAVVMVVQIALARLTTASLPKLPVSWGKVHMVLGLVAVGLIVLQYIIGDCASGTVLGRRVCITLDRQFGLFLGALAAAGLAYGGIRRSKEPDALPDITP